MSLIRRQEHFPRLHFPFEQRTSSAAWHFLVPSRGWEDSHQARSSFFGRASRASWKVGRDRSSHVGSSSRLAPHPAPHTISYPPIIISIMGNRIYDFLVDFVARFAAAVISHPVLHGAVQDVVVDGVNKLLEQPNLDERVAKAGKTLAKDKDVMAHKAGKEFPKVAGAFVKGMVRVGNPEKRDDNDEESKTSMNHESDTDGSQHDERTGKPIVSARSGHYDSDKSSTSKSKKARWLNPIEMMRHN
ncbi:hypothetical protein MPSEU_000770800 [Mayamaea pseudoterrestris]|nr:hypothetical protein MPSEU_000770800 [Mayamaea pseudoterrestris]